MKLELDESTLGEIQRHAESAYPDEGAGLVLGVSGDDRRQVRAILPLANSREAEARRNRYLISPQDIYQAELTAESMGLEVIGVFHSHPDHPAVPSEFDREWAMPWFSYVITSVVEGQADQSKSWRLSEDRQRFDEEQLHVVPALSRSQAGSIDSQ